MLIPAVLFLGYLKWQEEELEEKLEERIEQQVENQTLLVFSIEGLQQLYWEHEKEFQYKGEMYDVIDRYVRGDSVYLLCFHDREESHLKKQLYNYLARQQDKNPAQKQTESRIFAFLSKLVPSYLIRGKFSSEQVYQQLPEGQMSFFYRRENCGPSPPPPEV